MKRIVLILLLLVSTLYFSDCANAVCMQCPEIQKELKKDIKLSKTQKKSIKKITKDMKSQIKSYNKELKSNQKKIDKILNADCPDISLMMEIKVRNSEIKQDISKTKKEALAQIFEVYTEEQQLEVKRILSENSGIVTKGNCDFCDNKNYFKKKCKKCNKK